MIQGGCSDDAFSDFRANLISLGRNVYERALGDPETLAELNIDDRNDFFHEGYQYVKDEVAEKKIGQIPDRAVHFPLEPEGEPWDEDSVNNCYPKLSRKYPAAQVGGQSADDQKPWWKFW